MSKKIKQTTLFLLLLMMIKMFA